MVKIIKRGSRGECLGSPAFIQRGLSTCHGRGIQPLPSQSSHTGCYGAAVSAGTWEGGPAGLSFLEEPKAQPTPWVPVHRPTPRPLCPRIVGCGQGSAGPQGSCAQIRKRCPHVAGVAPTVHGW